MQKTIDMIFRGTTPEYLNYRMIIEDDLINLSRNEMLEKFESNKNYRIALESIVYYFESLSDLYHQDLIHKKFVRMRLGSTSVEIYGFLENYINETRNMTYDELNPNAPESVKENVPITNMAISWELMNADMIGDTIRYDKILVELENNILKRKEN